MKTQRSSIKQTILSIVTSFAAFVPYAVDLFPYPFRVALAEANQK